MRTITLEEHFVSKRFTETTEFNLGGPTGLDLSGGELSNLGALRLKHLDEAGIDLQVLSHVVPTVTPLPAGQQVDIARSANDQAAEAVAAHPDRFAAFAACRWETPTPPYATFSPNSQGRAFLDALPVDLADKEKISHLNAERLLNLAAAV